MTDGVGEGQGAGLARRMAQGSAWSLGWRWVVRGIGLVSTLLLVRLLSPEDFGIVTAAALLNEILQMLVNTGVSLALLRMPTPGRQHYDTVFTISLIRNLLIALLLLATADLQASFMAEPRVAGVVRVMALTALLDGFANVRLIDLQREFRFDVIARFEIGKKVIGFAIALPLAFWLRNYWALVVALPLQRLVFIPIDYWLKPYRPRLSLVAWRELFTFSKWILLGNLFLLIQGQMVTLFLARFTDMQTVGLYSVTRQLCELPVSELAAPVRAATYAGYARIWQDRTVFRRFVLGVTGLKTLIVLPMSAGLALCGLELVPLGLGPRWLEAVPLVPLVAWIVYLNSVREDLTDVFIALGRQAGYVAVLGVLSVLRGAAGYVATKHAGLEGMLWTLLGVVSFAAVVWLTFAAAYLSIRPRTLLGAIGRPWLATAAMSAAVLGLSLLWPAGATASEAMVRLGGKVALGVIVYVAAVLAMWMAAGRPAESAETVALRGLRAVRSKLALRPS